MRATSVAAAVALSAATAMVVLPAQAATARPGCPAPSAAELKRTSPDQPPKGANALKGVRVGHLPKGFTSGQVVASRHDGLTEYGYRWSDDRDDVDRAHRSLWVRVVCWPKAKTLAQLRKVPLAEGTFTGTATARIGGRKVLTKEGDGALGHGRYVGWVERDGLVVTVMAGEPLTAELGKIVKGVRVP